MNQLTNDQLAFLERFSRTPDARSLQEILGAELAAVEQSLRKLSDQGLYRAQGDAGRLDWLIAKLSAKPAPQSAPRAPRLTA